MGLQFSGALSYGHAHEYAWILNLIYVALGLSKKIISTNKDV